MLVLIVILKGKNKMIYLIVMVCIASFMANLFLLSDKENKKIDMELISNYEKSKAI